MSKRWILKVCSLVFLGLALSVDANASGEDNAAIIWVADTRNLSGVWKWIAAMYNEAPVLHAFYVILITAFQGIILGFTMDWLMQRTGLELKERELRE